MSSHEGFRIRLRILEQLRERFCTDIGVAQNALLELGVKNCRAMERNGDPSSSRVLIDPMASALAREGEAAFLQRATDLSGCDARQLRHQTATSIAERLNNAGCGTSSPVCLRSSMWRRIASLMFSTACSYVSPWL